MDLFRCKPIERTVKEETTHSFKRVLNGFHLILLGIGCIIGTGIFVLTGTAAAAHAGPALAISFIISGLGCLCYYYFDGWDPGIRPGQLDYWCPWY
jgi:APA family basic amino acid/polyamine antiporter